MGRLRTFTPNGTSKVTPLPVTRQRTHRAGTATALAVIASDADENQIRRLVENARARGYEASVYDVGPGVIMLPEMRASELDEVIGRSRAIERTFIPDTRYRLVRREVVPAGSTVNVGGVAIGGQQCVVIAGPCAVESRVQLLDDARAVASAGAAILRGGAFKPRTSPYNFQGLGLHGVELLAEARAATGLPVVTELMDPALIEATYALVDAFQVGARNMQNVELLRALGDVDKPVVLKRGPAATVEEWLLAAEYILAGGNDQVVLCERGIRTFNTATRFTLDLSSVAFAKRATHLPVIVDPSHATGDAALVPAMARAAIAAGADGVMVEVHPEPAAALSDGPQSLTPQAFSAMMDDLHAVAEAVGRSLVRPRPIATRA